MTSNSKRKVILVELNEINFDVVKSYIEDGTKLTNFGKMLANGIIETFAEKNYEELEPWIQWPSVHTGKTYNEHKIFRLGDITKSNIPQIFEIAESMGLKVGAISPMNAANRLSEPAYFIPDPWTDTPSDKSWVSRKLTKALKQSVNDNAQGKVTVESISYLLAALLTQVHVRYWPQLLLKVLFCAKKPWRKSILLDYMLHRIHIGYIESRKVHFSTIFLNAGAHLQHHYFFNAAPIQTKETINPPWYLERVEDPLKELLETYDQILGELFSLKDTEVVVATGLSQTPYDAVKYYYRLKQHENFLKMIGIDFVAVHPRMTRDFLIEFQDEDLSLSAKETLGRVNIDNTPVFGYIDYRGKELFVTLTYPREITHATTIDFNGNEIKLLEHVVFVAIKNGMHQSKGWLYSSLGFSNYPKYSVSVTYIFDHIRETLAKLRAVS